MAKKTKYYVIWEGRQEGIYTDWNEAKQQIDGFTGARYKGFESREEAEAAFKAGPPKFTPRGLNSVKVNHADTPNPIQRSVAVDAACAGNPGKMEYRGISLWDNKEIFHMQFELGTNNIGEFLAIVHALGLLKQHNAPDLIIYSDSVIAINWVKQKKCKTNLQLTPRTAQLLELVKRAETWLANNEVTNPIVKWPTEKWGEIPADFGRK